MTCLLFPIAVIVSWGYFLLSMWSGEGPAVSNLPFAVLTYVIAFLPSVMVTLYYRSRSRDISLPRTIVLAHLMPLYQMMWLVAGWRAVGRMISGKNGWAKTARIGQPPSERLADTGSRA